MIEKKNKYKKSSDIELPFMPEDTLDFHEFGLVTSFDIEIKLSYFLEDSFIKKYKQVIIITGKGEVVRPAVLKLLNEFQKKNKWVESFKTAGYFNGQSGAIEVSIKF